MKSIWKPALLLALLGLLIWSWGEQKSKEPDEKLASHFQDICKIADKGIAKPHKGVQKLFSYYGRQAPEMMKQFGALLVSIERIDDDDAHDERALLASRRMSKVLARCERTFERFALAIEADRKASQLLDRGLNRLARTFEILLGGTRGLDAFTPLRLLGSPVPRR